jgi:hypothetical protein
VWVPFLRFYLWALALVSTIVLHRWIWKWLMEFWSGLRTSGIWDVKIRWIGILSSGLFLISFLTASAPPIQYDALTYHLALPQAYLQHNQIVTLPDWTRAGMPQTGEMIYTWSMSLGGASASALTGWLAGVLAVLALVQFINQTVSPSTGWIGAAALLAGSSVSSALGWAYIDWFCLVFGLAAWIFWSRFRESSDTKELFLAGICAGFAFASKYTGGIIFLVLFVLTLVRSEKRLQGLWRLVLGFLIPSIPWLVKNLMTTGNPVAPFTWIPGESTSIQNLRPFGNIWDILILPIRATVIGVEGGVGYSHDIGPLLLLFGAGAWVFQIAKGKQSPFLADAGIATLVSIGVWIAGNQVNGLLVQSRMYYAMFPVFAILAAAGYEGLASLKISGVRVRRLLHIVIGLALGLTLTQSIRSVIRQGSLAYLTGVLSEEQYLEQNLGWYAPAMRAIGEGGKLTLLLYEPRGYYCSPSCTADEELSRWSIEYHSLGTCQKVLGKWKMEGYQIILVNQSGIDFFVQANDPNHTQSDLTALQGCLGELPASADFGTAYRLFGLE